MSDILTLEEMKARFPSEWVLINEPQWTGSSVDDLAGEVLFHSLDYDEVHRKTKELSPRPQHLAMRYLGPRHKNVAFLHMSESFDPNFEAIVLVRGMVSGPSGLVDKVVLLLDTGATTSVV